MYEGGLGLNARELLRNLLREVKALAKLHRLIVVEISPRILREAIKQVLKHHIYVADALQIVSAIKAGSSALVTGDNDLARTAEREGLKVVYRLIGIDNRHPTVYAKTKSLRYCYRFSMTSSC